MPQKEASEEFGLSQAVWAAMMIHGERTTFVLRLKERKKTSFTEPIGDHFFERACCPAPGGLGAAGEGSGADGAVLEMVEEG